MTLARQNFWVGLSIFILGLLFFLVASEKIEIISFESRFYLFALEMWRHGPSWFSTTYHQPYPDYPGTSTFIIYIFSKIMGDLSRFTAIIPSAVVSAMTLAMTYLIGAQKSKKWGLSAAFFLLLTYSFVAEARTISLDQYTTLITVTCFYLAMRGKIFWVFPLMIAGFAIRGPIGLVIPAGVLCVFYLLEKDIRKFLMFNCVATLLFLLCGMILLGLAYQQGGETFVDEVIKMQVVGRLQEAKRLPVDFYFVESFVAYVIVYPIAILVLLGIRTVRSSDKQFLYKIVGWALIVLIGLSIPTNKKIRYILPVAPALALMCGYLYTVGREHKYYYLLQRMIYSFCMFFPFLCFIMLEIIQKMHPEFSLHYVNLMMFFVLMQLVLFIIHFRFNSREIIALFITSIIFVSAYIWIVEPINSHLNRTHDFVQQTEAMRLHEQAQLAFYHEGRDGLAIKYMANMTTDEQPLFVLNAEDLLKYHQAIFFATSRNNFENIPSYIQQKMQVISYGKIGRENFVIFMHKYDLNKLS